MCITSGDNYGLTGEEGPPRAIRCRPNYAYRALTLDDRLLLGRTCWSSKFVEGIANVGHDVRTCLLHDGRFRKSPVGLRRESVWSLQVEAP